MPQRVAIWAAVSSKPQAEKDSVQDQLRDGARFAADRGYLLVAALVVPGESRSYVTLAEALAGIDNAMIDDGSIKTALTSAGLPWSLTSKYSNAYRWLSEIILLKQADILWCRSLDRLGRTDPLIAEIQYRCQQAGIQVYSAAMPPTGRIAGDLYVSAIERAGAQREIVELRRRHVYGMDARARNGLPMGSTLAFPYAEQWTQQGARLVRQAVVVPEWASAYQWIVDATLDRTHTAKQQCELLGGRVPDVRWTVRKLQETLRNPFHLGLIVRSRQYAEGEDQTERLRMIAAPPGDSLITHPAWPAIYKELLKRADLNRLCIVAVGSHAPVIDPDKWLELQRFLAARSEGHRPPSRNRLWSGLLYCGKCGAVLYAGNIYDRGNGEYVCSQRRRYKACSNPHVSERTITEQVAAWLEALANAPGLADTPLTDVVLAEPVRMDVDKELAELARRRERLLALFETGRIDLAAFDRRNGEIATIENGLRLQITRQESDGKRHLAAMQQAQTLRDAASLFRTRLAELPAAQANRWLRQLFRRIVVDERIVIRVEI